MSGTDAGRSAVPLDKLLQARPEQTVVRVFLPREQRDAVLAFEAVVFELEQALWHMREPQAAALKLQWWAEEWNLLAQGAARHPLSHHLPVPARAVPTLRAAAPRWGEAALHLLDDAPAAADFSAQMELLGRFYMPLAEIEAALFGRGSAAAPARAAAFLLRELGRLSLGQAPHRVSVPLHLLARHQLRRESLMEDTPAREALVHDQLEALGRLHPAVSDADLGLPLRLRLRLDRRLAARARRSARPSQVLRDASPLPLATAWHAWRAARGAG